MSFERPITIKEAIDNIHRKKYLLPAIQREFVWAAYQIEELFDSLMRDYPIGTFLFWYVEKNKNRDYQFYEFIRNYHERDCQHNPKADINGEDDIIAILDGQQRLTALYIGLKGTYAYKLTWRRWDNDLAFPKRHLHLNLLGKADDEFCEYKFLFLTDDEARKRDENTFWFKVGDILDIHKEFEVNSYLIKNQLLNLSEEKAQFANETLFKLFAVVHKNLVINYFLEKDETLDKVLNIFIRVNSGGTELSYSDLLLSIASAQWQTKDAREEITKFVDEISDMGDGFFFDKDFVLKTCLVLSDIKDIAFKVDNFNKQNMLTIERNWEKIAEAIRLTVRLVSSFGFSRDTLTSNNALIPIAYYLLKSEMSANFVQSTAFFEDRKRINKWLTICLLKKIFSGQPDNVLRPIRQILAENNSSFPFDDIVNKFRGGTNSLVFDDDEIENLFFYEYGKSYTFSTLALLYPTLDFRNKFHIDHIFPKSFFTRKKLINRGISENEMEFCQKNFNALANLQLLEGIANQEKSDMDFKEWVFKTYPNEQERKEYFNKHYIPNIDLSFDNFSNFIAERQQLMESKFISILKV